MVFLSKLGLALTLVFIISILFLLAELSYVLWWKKKNLRRHHTGEEISSEVSGDPCLSPSKELLYFFCWKNQSRIEPSEVQPRGSQLDLTTATAGPESFAKFCPATMDGELARLHSLMGPPRVLFTIKEESKEDLESDDGKIREEKGRREETPFVTPCSSPPFYTPCSSPLCTPGSGAGDVDSTGGGDFFNFSGGRDGSFVTIPVRD